MIMSNNHSIYGGGGGGGVPSTTTTPPPGGRHRSPAAAASMISHDDSFHPGVAVIIGILSTMFSLTFLILLYTKHCRPASGSNPAPPPPSDPASDVEAPPSISSSARHHLALQQQQQLLMDVDALLPPIPFHALLSARGGGGGGGASSEEEEEAAAAEEEEEKGLLEMMECAVCLARFERSDTLRLLPSCRHAFHAACLDTWFLSSTNTTYADNTNTITVSLQYSTCPLCRRLAIPPSSFLLRPPSTASPFRRHSHSDAASSAAYSPVDAARSVRHLIDIEIQPSAPASPPIAIDHILPPISPATAPSPPSSWHRAAADLFHGRSRRRTATSTSPEFCSSPPAASCNAKQQLGGGGSGSPVQRRKNGSGDISSGTDEIGGSKASSPAATYGSSGSAASINARFRLSPPDVALSTFMDPDVRREKWRSNRILVVDEEHRRSKQSGGGSNRSSPSALAMLQSRMRRSPREGILMGGDGGWKVSSGVRCCRSVEVADVEMAEAQIRKAERRCVSEITGIERRASAEVAEEDHQQWRRSHAASPIP